MSDDDELDEMMGMLSNDFNPDLLVNRAGCAMKLMNMMSPINAEECQRWLDLLYASVELTQDKKGYDGNVTNLH